MDFIDLNEIDFTNIEIIKETFDYLKKVNVEENQRLSAKEKSEIFSKIHEYHELFENEIANLRYHKTDAEIKIQLIIDQLVNTDKMGSVIVEEGNITYTDVQYKEKILDTFFFTCKTIKENEALFVKNKIATSIVIHDLMEFSIFMLEGHLDGFVK